MEKYYIDKDKLELEYRLSLQRLKNTNTCDGFISLANVARNQGCADALRSILNAVVKEQA